VSLPLESLYSQSPYGRYSAVQVGGAGAAVIVVDPTTEDVPPSFVADANALNILAGDVSLDSIT
jgi:hypothetical protein